MVARVFTLLICIACFSNYTRAALNNCIELPSLLVAEDFVTHPGVDSKDIAKLKLMPWHQEWELRRQKIFERAGLTEGEIQVIREISGPYFRKFTGRLRENEYRTPKEQQDNIHLQSAISKLRPYHTYYGFVYRGIRGKFDEESIALQFKVGEIYTDKAFTIASRSYDSVTQEFLGPKADGISLTIFSKNGISLAGISVHFEEKEVIFDAGTKFRVLRIIKQGDHRFQIDLEEI